MAKGEAFEALKKKWYGKLKASGFEDIESSETYLKTWSNKLALGHGNEETFYEKRVYYESREQYFRLVGHFLHDHKFASTLEKKIWELHGQGLGVREIQVKLNHEHVTELKKTVIHDRIKRLAKLMFEAYKVGKSD